MDLNFGKGACGRKVVMANTTARYIKVTHIPFTNPFKVVERPSLSIVRAPSLVPPLNR
jgi:hypothetical protein